MFLDNKIFGVGMKNFRNYCSDDKYQVSKLSCSTHPHNTYIQILTETGLFGFLFILVLLFSTGLAFQLPVIQVVLGVLRIFSSRLMFSVWRYVTLGSTIVGAILTPSVDPITQLFMSSIIMILYFGGAGIVFLIERSQENIDYEEKF